MKTIRYLVGEPDLGQERQCEDRADEMLRVEGGWEERYCEMSALDKHLSTDDTVLTEFCQCLARQWRLFDICKVCVVLVFIEELYYKSGHGQTWAASINTGWSNPSIKSILDGWGSSNFTLTARHKTFKEKILHWRRCLFLYGITFTVIILFNWQSPNFLFYSTCWALGTVLWSDINIWEREVWRTQTSSNEPSDCIICNE